MAAIILWGVVSLIFFIANAGLAIGSIARGRSPTKPLIACALPIVCVVLPLLLGALFCAVTVSSKAQITGNFVLRHEASARGSTTITFDAAGDGDNVHTERLIRPCE